METMSVVQKPRVSYAQFVAAQEQQPRRTVAWLIQQFIDRRSRPGARPLGLSHGYTLRRLQRDPIGAKLYDKLKPVDFLEHCQGRIAAGVLPQTVNQDATYLSGILKYAFEIMDLSEDGIKAYKKAKPQLVREQLIAKSTPRDRLPTDEEEALLRALFTKRNETSSKRPKTIDMVLVMDAELVTGRRISELCRIERQHVNVEKRTCWLYNMKNAKGKGHHAEFALIEGAWELFERRLREIPEHPTARLFPFRAQSCSQAYTIAKAKLREEHPGLFENLRMHDNRAECFVRLLDLGYSKEQVQKGVSLHKGDGKVLVDTYLRIKAADLHRGPAARPQAAA